LKRKLREKKIQVFQLGHILFEHYGKLTSKKSLLRSKEHNKYIQDLISKRPEIKEEILQKIKRIKKIVEDYNLYFIFRYNSI